jgi:hypothetical protein
MAKTKITEYSNTAASNTDVGNIQIEGSDDVANFDNALREIMKQIADLNTGASFIHDTYKIADSDAETRLAKFDAGSITAGQTRTFTFPDVSGTFAMADDVLALSGGTMTGDIDMDVNDFIAPLIKVDNIAPSAGGTEFSLIRGVVKAGVNFNSIGTVAIRDSENVSSLTDNGTGDYDINFTDYFDNTNYTSLLSAAQLNGALKVVLNEQELSDNDKLVSGLRVRSGYSDGAADNKDTDGCYATFLGDLA